MVLVGYELTFWSDLYSYQMLMDVIEIVKKNKLYSLF